MREESVKFYAEFYGKGVEYLGLTIHVPEWVKYVTVDKDGEMYGHEEKPTIDGDDDFWYSSESTYISNVKLTNINWKDTLREV